MTIEADIFNTVKSLVSNRVYPDIAPAGTTRPYITYQQVGGSSINYLTNSLPAKRNARFQISVWGVDRLSIAILSRQVEDTLRTSTTIEATVLSAPVASYEQDSQLFGSRQDFSFWHLT